MMVHTANLIIGAIGGVMLGLIVLTTLAEVGSRLVQRLKKR